MLVKIFKIKITMKSDISRCLLIGNSRWHWATKTSNCWQFSHTKPETEKSIIKDQPPLIAWAAVGQIPNNPLLSNSIQIKTENIPIKRLPSWIGVDRALVAWAAIKKLEHLKSDSSGVLIADAGTIFSMTRVTANKEFGGGQLMPGLSLQLSAMANGAHNLQICELTNASHEKFPHRTEDAMQRGCIDALVASIVESKKAAKMPLWICGGDAHIILKELNERNIQAFHHKLKHKYHYWERKN